MMTSTSPHFRLLCDGTLCPQDPQLGNSYFVDADDAKQAAKKHHQEHHRKTLTTFFRRQHGLKVSTQVIVASDSCEAVWRCDRCNASDWFFVDPSSDLEQATLEAAAQVGWSTDDQGDVCDKCVAEEELDTPAEAVDEPQEAA